MKPIHDRPAQPAPASRTPSAEHASQHTTTRKQKGRLPAHTTPLPTPRQTDVPVARTTPPSAGSLVSRHPCSLSAASVLLGLFVAVWNWEAVDVSSGSDFTRLRKVAEELVKKCNDPDRHGEYQTECNLIGQFHGALETQKTSWLLPGNTTDALDDSSSSLAKALIRHSPETFTEDRTALLLGLATLMMVCLYMYRFCGAFRH